MSIAKDTDGSVHMNEYAVDTSASAGHAAKHGDMAMRLIGQERVILTEDDVRC
jgi:hypothetical protein